MVVYKYHSVVKKNACNNQMNLINRLSDSSQTKEYIPCDSIYMKTKNRQN